MFPFSVCVHVCAAEAVLKLHENRSSCTSDLLAMVQRPTQVIACVRVTVRSRYVVSDELCHKRAFTEAESRASSVNEVSIYCPLSLPLHNWVLVLSPGEKV